MLKANRRLFEESRALGGTLYAQGILAAPNVCVVRQ
jgi:hypothetical protein